MRALPLAAILSLTLASCASPPAPVLVPETPRPVAPPPAPPPVVAPRPAPPPAPMPAPLPLPANWQDWPFSPGDWSYRPDAQGSAAYFGPVGGNAEVVLRCDRQTRSVSLSRAGSIGGSVPMTVRTTDGTLTWPAQNGGGASAMVAATRGAGDAGLDQILFSRGRFTVELPGMAPMVLRPWAEMSRVIEDCR